MLRLDHDEPLQQPDVAADRLDVDGRCDGPHIGRECLVGNFGSNRSRKGCDELLDDLGSMSNLREPPRGFFVLIGLAARVLSGASADSVETLAQRLHQDSLLTGAPQLGRVGGAVVRCDPGDRPDGFGVGSLCRLAADRPRRGLSRAASPG